MAHQESNHPTLRTCSAGLGPHPHAVTHLGLITAGAALGKVTEGVEEGGKGLQRVTAAASDSDRIAAKSTASDSSAAATATAEEGNDRHGVNCAVAKGRAADRGGMLRYGRAGTVMIISPRSTSGVVRCSTLAGGVAGAAAIAGMAMTAAAAGGRAGPVHRTGRTGVAHALPGIEASYRARHLLLSFYLELARDQPRVICPRQGKGLACLC